MCKDTTKYVTYKQIDKKLWNYATKTAKKNKSLVTYSRLLSNLYTDSLFREE